MSNVLKAYWDEPLKAMAPRSGVAMMIGFAAIACCMDAFVDCPLRKRL